MNNENNPYIFDIQRFSIHDGPGIRTVLFTKGCPLNCIWCQNPESQKYKSEIAFYFEKCLNCLKCVEICPTKSIDFKTKISNYSTCNACNACVDICENDARKIIGKKTETDEIITELLKDIDFYNDSNGGITFSGGEPFAHIEFLTEIISILKKENININIETCGYFNFESAEKILHEIDLIYFDIKHINNNLHKEFTGVSNKIILNNFEKLNSIFKNIQVRIPLIPGINDNIESIKLFCEYLLKNGHKTVHLLPYHSMGNSKAIRIDFSGTIFKVETHSKSELNNIKTQFAENGINPITYE
jgi:pyruvate formate lyase activating enzyme